MDSFTAEGHYGDWCDGVYVSADDVFLRQAERGADSSCGWYTGCYNLTECKTEPQIEIGIETKNEIEIETETGIEIKTKSETKIETDRKKQREEKDKERK